MNDKRSFRLTIHLNKIELDTILLAAACSHESPGRFARKLITELVEKDREDVKAERKQR